MDRIQLAAFSNEMQKIAGVGGFFTKGIKTLGRLGSQGSKRQVGSGPYKTSLGGLWRHARMAYKRGAKGEGGVLGGIGAAMKTPAAAAAGTVGTGGLAAYGGYKAITGDRRPKQTGY